MTVANAADVTKTVGDPNAAYESMRPLWLTSRAACSGGRFVKALDQTIDVNKFTNLLSPFSPSMTQQQYDFYKSEAEWPGIVSTFSRTLVDAILRKAPQLTLPASVPPEARDWILNEFGEDGTPMSAFLGDAIWEEIQTARSVIFVDYTSELSETNIIPYPVIQKAENVINWRRTKDASGKMVVSQIILKGLEESYADENQFHPTLREVIRVHELFNGAYQVRKYVAESDETSAPVVQGQPVPKNTKKSFKLVDVIPVLVNNESLDFVPAWPLNGSIDLAEPILWPLIEKEISLYNKMSRRNHLLYGAATYTPYVCSDMTDEKFTEVVEAGLGSWLHLGQSDSIGVLATPTEALQDMDKAIAAGIEEMAKLGVRMLTPETAQSGVALELRNASQTARLGSLHTKIINTMKQVVTFMINWRYDLEISASEVEVTLSNDFSTAPSGEVWLRLATEWYEAGLIPRSVWLALLKQHDLLPDDYDDEVGKKELTEDELIITQPDVAVSDYQKQIRLKPDTVKEV